MYAPDWVKITKENQPPKNVVILLSDGVSIVTATVDGYFSQDGGAYYSPECIEGYEWELVLNPTHWAKLEIILPS